MDRQKEALERLIKEGARALEELARSDPNWYDSHFSAALDRAAQVLGYTSHVEYIRHINDPDIYPFVGMEWIPF